MGVDGTITFTGINYLTTGNTSASLEPHRFPEDEQRNVQVKLSSVTRHTGRHFPKLDIFVVIFTNPNYFWGYLPLISVADNVLLLTKYLE